MSKHPPYSGAAHSREQERIHAGSRAGSATQRALSNLGERAQRKGCHLFCQRQAPTASGKFNLGMNFLLDSWEREQLKPPFLAISEHRIAPHLSSRKPLMQTAGRQAATVRNKWGDDAQHFRGARGPGRVALETRAFQSDWRTWVRASFHLPKVYAPRFTSVKSDVTSSWGDVMPALQQPLPPACPQLNMS